MKDNKTSEEGDKRLFIKLRGRKNFVKSGTLDLGYKKLPIKSFDEIEGFYLSAKIASQIPLLPRLNLGMALSCGYGDAGYNRGYFNVSDPSFIDILFTTDLTYKLTDSVSLAARGQYMSLLDRTLKDAVPPSERTHLMGCLSVIIDF